MSVTAPLDVLKSTRPEAGVSIDETRTVRTCDAAPAPSIRIRCEYAEIYLSTALLEELSKLAVANWRTEEERLALIAGRRAKQLLAAAAQQQPLIAPLAPELTQVVLLLLENGAAHVRHATHGVPLATLGIRYIGQRMGPTAGFGRIVVSEPTVGLPLLTCDWWVA